MTVKTKCFAILSVIWMVLIFMLSAQTVDESSRFSDAVTRLILNFLEPGEHREEPQSDVSDDVPAFAEEKTVIDTAIDFFSGGNSPDYDPVPKKEWFGISPTMFKSKVRDAAHFIMFLGLGVFFTCTLLSHFGRLTPIYALLSVSACAVYAGFDEIHQLFVDGRGAQLIDVRTDCIGAAIGVALVAIGYMIAVWRRKRRERSLLYRKAR